MAAAWDGAHGGAQRLKRQMRWKRERRGRRRKGLSLDEGREVVVVAVALVTWSLLHVLTWWRVEAEKGRRRERQRRLRRGA